VFGVYSLLSFCLCHISLIISISVIGFFICLLRSILFSITALFRRYDYIYQVSVFLLLDVVVIP